MKREYKKIPGIIGFLLDRMLPDSDNLYLKGDYEEIFNRISIDKGSAAAHLWISGQVLKSLPVFLFDSIFWSLIMIKNYLTIAFRSMVRHKGYTFINIAGIAIGFTASIIIFLYVYHELSHDRFHSKSDSIYRVLLIDRSLGVSNNHAGIITPTMGPALKKELPEVVESVRIWRRGRSPLNIGDRTVYSTDFAFADPEIFTMFDFGLETGDKNTAIVEPNTAVITRDMAEKLFGSEDPVGKSFDVTGRTLTITGILSEIPDNSHMKFDIIASINVSDTTSTFYTNLHRWNSFFMPTYIQLDNPESSEGLDEKMIEIIRKNGLEESFSVTHQPLHDIHLKSGGILFEGYNQGEGDINFVYSLGAIAFFIILIASFNFMNLTTARSANRAREVGMRKVVGAHRRQLIGQFLSESLILCISGFIIALILVLLLSRYIGSAYSLNLNLSLLANPLIIGGLTGAAVIVGLLSGTYPAFVLSSFRPVVVLKGVFRSSGHAVILRKLLVVLQFTASIAMIICSGIVIQQIDYIKSKNIGYDRSQVLTLTINRDMYDNFGPLTDKLVESPAILSWSSSDNVPGRGMARSGVLPEGAAEDETWVVSYMFADDQFVETMGMEMAEGRYFSRDYGTDTIAVIMNEAAVKAIGWEDPVGKTFNRGSFTVIGVVKDFHFTTLHHQIEPLTILYRQGPNRVLSLKLKAGAIQEAVAHIEQTWNELYPGNPFEYSFLDDEFDKLYRNEENFGSMTRGFTGLAILVACMGLFGLASHTVQQSTKEIGIRKVLGASAKGLVMLLTKDFIRLVLIANVIAWPAAWYFMDRWLQSFVYRTDMDWSIYVISGGIAFIIAVATVSSQALRAAHANPVDSLRYE